MSHQCICVLCVSCWPDQAKESQGSTCLSPQGWDDKYGIESDFCVWVMEAFILERQVPQLSFLYFPVFNEVSFPRDFLILSPSFRISSVFYLRANYPKPKASVHKSSFSFMQRKPGGRSCRDVISDFYVISPQPESSLLLVSVYGFCPQGYGQWNSSHHPHIATIRKEFHVAPCGGFLKSRAAVIICVAARCSDEPGKMSNQRLCGGLRLALLWYTGNLQFLGCLGGYWIPLQSEVTSGSLSTGPAALGM